MIEQHITTTKNPQKMKKKQENNATRKNANQDFKKLNSQGVFLCLGVTSQCFPPPPH
jgi:hypothetical protein